MTKQLTEWDASIGLDSAEEIAGYLDAALEDGDPHIVAAVLGNIVRAKGMANLARETGLSHESLNCALGGNEPLFLDMFLKILKALGLRLTVLPVP